MDGASWCAKETNADQERFAQAKRDPKALRQRLANGYRVRRVGRLDLRGGALGQLLPFFIGALEDGGFSFMDTLIWVKNVMVLGRSEYHHRHEAVLYGWRQDAAHYFCPTGSRTPFSKSITAGQSVSSH